MSNWMRWPPVVDTNSINWQFGNLERIAPFTYPDLRDGSPLILASDYSGEHADPEFRVLAFLLTTYRSVISAWEPLRLAVRKRFLADGRRMSFKDLNDALRINALASFLEAASQLNGVLACIAVEKSFSLTGKDRLPPLQHSWAADPLEKLLEICVFGGGFVDGLRGAGQDLHWITDDDAIVATDAAKDDAGNLMGSFLHKYPEEFLRIGLGVASQFSDDDRRAEDIVAIPDLAAGPLCEALTNLGKSNIPTSETGPSISSLLLQLKSSLINVWRSDFDKPLRHLNVVIRATENGKTLVSFCQPFIRLLRPSESAEGAPTLNAKWRRAMETYLKDRGVDPVQTLKSLGIDI